MLSAEVHDSTIRERVNSGLCLQSCIWTEHGTSGTMFFRKIKQKWSSSAIVGSARCVKPAYKHKRLIPAVKHDHGKVIIWASFFFFLLPHIDPCGHRTKKWTTLYTICLVAKAWWKLDYLTGESSQHQIYNRLTDQTSTRLKGCSETSRQLCINKCLQISINRTAESPVKTLFFTWVYESCPRCTQLSPNDWREKLQFPHSG